MIDPIAEAARTARLLKDPPGGEPTGPFVMAKVESLGPEITVDGLPVLRLRWRGVVVISTFLASYTPAVDHVCACLYDGARLTAIGRVIGNLEAL